MKSVFFYQPKVEMDPFRAWTKDFQHHPTKSDWPNMTPTADMSNEVIESSGRPGYIINTPMNSM